MKVFLVRALLLLLSPWLLQAEPTIEREWKSTAGTTMTARALSITNGKVTFERTNGKKITVPLSKLGIEERDFLKKHFKSQASKLQAPKGHQPPTLPYELGKWHGPIQASAKSSYHIYLPKSMSEKIQPPILFFTGFKPSGPKDADRFSRAAELTGVALAVSVEGKNQGGSTFPVNNSHAKACLKHIKRTLPIDTDRAIFSGTSGGGASSFFNVDKLKSIGAIPYVAYIPDNCGINKKAFYYIGGGARDPNRYASASAAKKAGKRGIHRTWLGGHVSAKEPEAFEGLLWIYTRHMFESGSKHGEERALFQSRLVPWLEKLAKSRPPRAYFWTDHLLRTCSVEGPLADAIKPLHDSLATCSQCTKYLAAFQALVRFTEETYAPALREGQKPTGAKLPDSIIQAAKALEEEVSDVPEFAAIAKQLGQTTSMK